MSKNKKTTPAATEVECIYTISTDLMIKQMKLLADISSECDHTIVPSISNAMANIYNAIKES